MRHIPLCLVVPFVLACGTGPSEPTIRLEGTVTALDDGSPVAGARLIVFANEFGGPYWESHITDASGRYALSFSTNGIGCQEDEFYITVNAIRFGFGLLTLWDGNSGIRCTDELQTLDFQLQRLAPASSVTTRSQRP